jgi:uncharacterized protein (DUF302 family)
MTPLQDSGIVHLSSAYPVPETLKRLEAIVLARGLSILACIDHSGDAAKVGLKMHLTQLLIFGNPRGHAFDDRFAHSCN